MAAWLTTEDESNYGRELLDVSQRAALHALSPTIQNLEQQNAELQRRLAKESRHRLDQQVEAAVPNYREIDRDPDWHRWLLGYDALSGVVRQQLLNSAIQRGDSSSVIAFFKGFERESGGNQAAAPGRARTASSGKQIYTPELIGRLYEANRKGAYAGRESEWARQEADIFAAQREGRVQGLPYLTK